MALTSGVPGNRTEWGIIFVHHSNPESLARAGVVICDAPGKGKGLFALRELCANTVICAERSVLDKVGAKGKREDVRRLESAFRCLPASDQGAIMALHDCHCAGPDGQKSVVGIYNTNALEYHQPSQAPRLTFSDAKERGICPVVSRLNHSCVPNGIMVYHADRDHFALVTCRHIRAGEEICISYIDSQVMARASRQEELQRTYKFSCTCPACCPGSDADAIQSDEHRNAIRLLEAEFGKGGPAHPRQFMEKILQLLVLHGREGTLNPAVTGRLHGELMMPLLMLNATLEDIQDSAQMCLKCYRLVHGQHSASMKRFGRYVERSRTEEALQAWRTELRAFHQVFQPMGPALFVMCSVTALLGPFGWLYLALGAALLLFAGRIHFAVALAVCGRLPWPLSGWALASSVPIWFGMAPLYGYFRM